MSKTYKQKCLALIPCNCITMSNWTGTWCGGSNTGWDIYDYGRKDSYLDPASLTLMIRHDSKPRDLWKLLWRRLRTGQVIIVKHSKKRRNSYFVEFSGRNYK